MHNIYLYQLGLLAKLVNSLRTSASNLLASFILTTSAGVDAMIAIGINDLSM